MSFRGCCSSLKCFTRIDPQKTEERLGRMRNLTFKALTTWLQNWFTATWSAEGAIVFKLDGVSVCQQAWLICHGVSEHKYYKAKQTFFSQRPSTE
ncbi:hypothetical protein PROFUN_17039, partial [Planoprotostelium fungivorum]